MGVNDLLAFQHDVLSDWCRNPRAWFLQANPVWGRYEDVNKIAVFDTEEMAMKYLESSRLPKLPEGADPDIYKTKDGYWRSFRPDSLLWDYNDEGSARPMIVPVLPWHQIDHLTPNPLPLVGPVPELEGFFTRHPKYGRDYDVGFGGPRTDVSDVTPAPPPAGPMA